MFQKILHNIQKHYLAYSIIFFGFVGTYASFHLLSDRIELYKNVNFVPSCSLNVWLDCGQVNGQIYSAFPIHLLD